MSDSMTPPPQPSAGAPSHDPLVGTTLLDRVQIIAPIARGGMGKVYLGEQTRMKRPCAIKVLDPRSRRAPREASSGGASCSRPASLRRSHAPERGHDLRLRRDRRRAAASSPWSTWRAVALADELKRRAASAPERAIHIARQVCARAARSARARRRAPRHEAGQRLSRQARRRRRLREGARLRPGRGDVARLRRAGRRARAGATSWARRGTWRPSRCRARTSTRGPTSTRWARCSTRCWPGRPPFDKADRARDDDGAGVRPACRRCARWCPTSCCRRASRRS